MEKAISELSEQGRTKLWKIEPASIHSHKSHEAIELLRMKSLTLTFLFFITSFFALSGPTRMEHTHTDITKMTNEIPFKFYISTPLDRYFLPTEKIWKIPHSPENPASERNADFANLTLPEKQKTFSDASLSTFLSEPPPRSSRFAGIFSRRNFIFYSFP